MRCKRCAQNPKDSGEDFLILIGYTHVEKWQVPIITPYRVIYYRNIYQQNTQFWSEPMKTESNIQHFQPLDENLNLLRTPEPPYIAVISTSIHSADEKEAYQQALEKTEAIAQTLPGFLGMESAEELLEGGRSFDLSAIYWQNMDALEQWRKHPEHIAVKKQGKKVWYEEHNIRVCQVLKQYGTNLTQGHSNQLAYPEDKE